MGFLGEDASNLRLFDFLLRLFVVPVSIAAIWIAVTTKQDNSIYGNLEFKSLVGLKYMVSISGICAGYALFAAVSSWCRWLVSKAWIFFVTDQVLAYLMVTSMAALGEFLYLAYNGDQVVSWSEACASYGYFCNKLKFALGLHVIAVFCFLILAVISAYRAFRIFEPPFVPSKEAQQDMT